jgi:hypothetical protein
MLELLEARVRLMRKLPARAVATESLAWIVFFRKLYARPKRKLLDLDREDWKHYPLPLRPYQLGGGFAQMRAAALC